MKNNWMPAPNSLRSIADFNEFSLQEQLQAFFETQFELFLADREFVDVSFRAITFSLTHDYQYLKPIRKRFFRIISDLFEAAIEVGEIPDLVFLELTYHFSLGLLRGPYLLLVEGSFRTNSRTPPSFWTRAWIWP